MPATKRPYTVYRLYDEAGMLLYVGATGHWPRRMNQHRSMALWGKQIARGEVETFRTREQAAQHEARLIRELHPAHNRTDHMMPVAPIVTERTAKTNRADISVADLMVHYDDLLFVKDAALALGVTSVTVTRWINAGCLSALRLAGNHCWRIPRVEVERYRRERLPSGKPYKQETTHPESTDRD